MTTEAQYKANKMNAKKPGRKPGSVAPHTLQAAEARKMIVDFVTRNLEPILNVVLEKALQGDMVAVKELLDRGFGRASQSVELSGKEGQAIVFMPVELMNKHQLIDGNTQVIEGTVKSETE